MATLGLSVGALCAGYGGIELGLRNILDTEMVWFSDICPGSDKVIKERFGNIPNLGDLTEISQQLFEPEKVDIVTAGFPCQPVSTGGLRKGVKDERWLISDVCKVARLAGARYLLLENVGAILTANNGEAMGRVCEALAENGYIRWEWLVIRASDVGAPHKRERWFCVATNDDEPGRKEIAGLLREDRRWQTTEWSEGDSKRAGSLGASRTFADSDNRTGEEFDIGDGYRDREEAGINRTPTSEPERFSLSGSSFERYQPAIRRWEQTIGRGSPAPHTGIRIYHEAPSDSHGEGSEGQHTRSGLRETSEKESSPGGNNVGDSSGRLGKYKEYGPAIGRWEAVLNRRVPEDLTYHHENGSIKVSPEFIEWMMGVPPRWVTGVDLSYTRKLELLGNGVVPQQAERAYAILLERVTSNEKTNKETN